MIRQKETQVKKKKNNKRKKKKEQKLGGKTSLEKRFYFHPRKIHGQYFKK